MLIEGITFHTNISNIELYQKIIDAIERTLSDTQSNNLEYEVGYSLARNSDLNLDKTWKIRIDENHFPNMENGTTMEELFELVKTPNFKIWIQKRAL